MFAKGNPYNLHNQIVNHNHGLTIRQSGSKTRFKAFRGGFIGIKKNRYKKVKSLKNH